MDAVVVGIIALIVGAVVGILIGRSSGKQAGIQAGRALGLEAGRKAGLQSGRREGAEEGRSRGFQEGLQKGREEGRAAGAEEGRAVGLEEGRALGLEAGRAEQVDELRGREREAALREAVGRVTAFLHSQVRAPLAGATEEAEADELRERIGRALGALEDLDFFIAETDAARQGTDLAKLAQTVAREFAGDHDVGVRVLLEQASVHAHVNPNALLDALYLVLHNAARFGGGATIDLTVVEKERRARITVRDRGSGFSEEAFSRAFDPFYSTSSEGLGLGLPHARKVVEGMGGAIELRNRPDGGAEVELSFPASG